MLKVVFDTNVLISAFIYGGIPLEILILGLKARIEVFISPPILKEVEEVLRRKFNWPRERVQESVEILKGLGKIVAPFQEVMIFKGKNSADNRVLECALEVDADYIVSGDHGLQSLKHFHKAKILSPREFFNLFS